MKSSHLHLLGAVLLSCFAFSVNLKADDALPADNSTDTSTANPTDNSAGSTDQKRPHFMKELGLTDAQKAQIKQIIQTTPKGKDRREAILAVLTPEQKAQLKQEIEQWKADHK